MRSLNSTFISHICELGVFLITAPNEPKHEKTYLWACAPSKHSHVHSRSLIRIFTGRILDNQGCKGSSSGLQIRFWIFVGRTCQKVRFLTFPLKCFCKQMCVFFFFFHIHVYGFYGPFNNISLMWADRSSKVGETWRTRGKPPDHQLFHVWPEPGSNTAVKNPISHKAFITTTSDNTDFIFRKHKNWHFTWDDSHVMMSYFHSKNQIVNQRMT